MCEVRDGCGHVESTLAVLSQQAWWDKLPADVRGALSESIQRLVKEQRAEVEAENDRFSNSSSARDVSVRTFSCGASRLKNSAAGLYQYVPRWYRHCERVQQEVEIEQGKEITEGRKKGGNDHERKQKLTVFTGICLVVFVLGGTAVLWQPGGRRSPRSR
jgi:hypothetical protein